MKHKLRLVALLLGGLSLCSMANTKVDWGYEGQEAPDHWGELSSQFSLCETGRNQSPIDISTTVDTQNHEFLKLTFALGKQQIVNNGHTIQVDLSPGNTLTLDNDLFDLLQFHFHAPSENTINGKHFPLEAHFVYRDKDNELTVLALMFNSGKANKQLERAWQSMPNQKGQSALLKMPVDIAQLLPKKFSYYRFSGSLTTPPCSEGVTWLVLDTPVEVSEQQIQQFITAIPHTNNRPVQPLHHRIVTH